MYEDRQANAYRVEYETVGYDQKQVTSFRPVMETELRERRYTVARPVFETSEAKSAIPCSGRSRKRGLRIAATTWSATSLKLRNAKSRYIVARPVYETQEREDAATSCSGRSWRRAIRDEAYTVMQPVTTVRQVQVDQGTFVNQMVCKPGAAYNRLAWQPAACVVDPVTGQVVNQRAGLAWVPLQAPGARKYCESGTEYCHAANSRTSLVPQTVVRKVPVQVCRVVNEEVVRKVPVQVCRTVQEEQVRRVPYTVCRQVTEHGG